MNSDQEERLGMIADDIVNGEFFEVICEENPGVPDSMRRDHGIAYSTRCPNCGRLLLAVEDQPDTAPWVCNTCHLGFWAAELTDVARGCYSPPLEWTGPYASAIRQGVQLERLQAHQRGISLRPDQLILLSVEALHALAARPRLHPDFLAATTALIERHG